MKMVSAEGEVKGLKNENSRGTRPQEKNKSGKIFLSERIQLKKSLQLYGLCHRAKNLYNQANHVIKTTLDTEGKWVRYVELYHNVKDSKNYKELPAQTAQQVMRLLDKNWTGFFRAIKDWRKIPEKYRKKPEPPRYKRKDGESIVIFTNQQCRIKGRFLHFPGKANLDPIKINKDRISHFQQVRLLPRGTYYVLEIVHEKEKKINPVDEKRIISIDLGLNNVVCVVNNAGLRPWVVKGGAIKSINQFYNKMRSKYQSIKDQQGIKFQTKRLRRLTRKRNNKISDLFHKLSRFIINYCLTNGFGTIVIGYNDRWKENCNMGRKNNQNFLNVPFHQLVQQIQYKAELDDIQVIKVDESHTSKCSFLDGEAIEHHDHYMGRRIKRGLFKSKKGKTINADVNGAYNILRKAFPKGINPDGIEGLGLVPYSVKITELKQSANLISATNEVPKAIKVDGIVVEGYNLVSRKMKPN